jgi:threonine/homoserine/homoserine lactone efflux protein
VIDTVVFAATSFGLLALPGPTNVLLASAGATSGKRALPLVIIQAATYFVVVGSLVLLTGRFRASAPVLIPTLKFACAAWLFWTGVALWRNHAKALCDVGRIRARTVLLTTLLNPKGMVIAFGLMPPEAATTALLISNLSVLAMIATTTGCLWMAVGAALGRVGAAPYAEKTTGVVLGAFSVFLIFITVYQ